MLKVCHITSAHPRYDIRIFIKECTTLANNGYKVSLIVADNLADEIASHINIYNVGKATSRLNRMWQTPRDIYAKILELKPDVVHFHDPELMLIALKLVKHEFKVIYDVHEDLPKQIQNKHWLPKFSRGVISKLVESLEKFVAKRISGIVAATPIIAKRFAMYNQNTVTVCNYPILSELDINCHCDGVSLQRQNRQDTLCYIGSISKTRGIISLIESLAISKLTLELAGPLSSDVTLDALSSLDGWQYVNYRGVLERREIIDLLSRAKIGLVTLLPTPSYLESLPIKMFEYMLAGIPVIASDFPLWHDIITKYNCGLLVDPNDRSGIASACKYLLEHVDTAKQMGVNGENVVRQYFNWEAESKKLISFYCKLQV